MIFFRYRSSHHQREKMKKSIVVRDEEEISTTIETTNNDDKLRDTLRIECLFVLEHTCVPIGINTTHEANAIMDNTVALREIILPLFIFAIYTCSSISMLLFAVFAFLGILLAKVQGKSVVPILVGLSTLLIYKLALYETILKMIVSYVVTAWAMVRLLHKRQHITFSDISGKQYKVEG